MVEWWRQGPFLFSLVAKGIFNHSPEEERQCPDAWKRYGRLY